MQTMVSSLTALSVLLHVLLGCHAHHVHAGESLAASLAAHQASPGGCHHHRLAESEPSSPSEHQNSPCVEDSCDFAVSKVDAPSLDDGGPTMSALIEPMPPALASVNCGSATLGSGLYPGSSLALLYCVLRN
jgi:hypothetical protein